MLLVSICYFRGPPLKTTFKPPLKRCILLYYIIIIVIVFTLNQHVSQFSFIFNIVHVNAYLQAEK